MNIRTEKARFDPKMPRKPKNIVENFFRKAALRQIRRNGAVAGLLIIAALILFGFLDPDLQNKLQKAVENPAPTAEDDTPLDSKKKSPLKEGVRTVVHVVDGDTLDVQQDGTKYRVRLIGANTPETVKPNHPVEPFGPEASAFTKQMIAKADNRVRIAFDGDQVDRYDRNLAMVYLQLPQGEVWLNELLVKEGLAKAELQYRFSKGAKEKLRRAEEDAQTAKRNLWSGK